MAALIKYEHIVYEAYRQKVHCDSIFLLILVTYTLQIIK